MPNEVTERIRIPHFLDIATYVSMAAMSLLGISGLPGLSSQLLALGLVILFGGMYHFAFQSGRYERNRNLYFAVQALILGLLFLLGSNNSDAFNFLFLILCIHIAAVSPARVAVFWIALCFGIVSLIILATRGTEGLYAIVFYSITFIVSGFFGYTIQQVERERDRNQRLVEELQAAQHRLRELAVVEERNRLARDLHDSVKQQVFALSMQLSAARAALQEADQAYPPVVRAEKLAQQAGAELTTLIHQLRPQLLESKTLAAALQDHVSDWSRQNNIAIHLRVEDDLSLNGETEQALFRVVQEALANVARHSRATQASVELVGVDAEVLLCISDNGAGFDMGRAQTGVGLSSMRERVAQMGGTFHVWSKQGGGTQITARWRRS